MKCDSTTTATLVTKNRSQGITRTPAFIDFWCAIVRPRFECIHQLAGEKRSLHDAEAAQCSTVKWDDDLRLGLNAAQGRTSTGPAASHSWYGRDPFRHGNEFQKVAGILQSRTRSGDFTRADAERLVRGIRIQ